MYELRHIGSFITALFFIANEGRHVRMKNKKYHIITVPKFNRKFVEKGKMDTTNTHRYVKVHFHRLVCVLQ